MSIPEPSEWTLMWWPGNHPGGDDGSYYIVGPDGRSVLDFQEGETLRQIVLEHNEYPVLRTNLLAAEARALAAERERDEASATARRRAAEVVADILSDRDALCARLAEVEVSVCEQLFLWLVSNDRKPACLAFPQGPMREFACSIEDRALAAEADARRLAEEVAAVNENHYAMKGEPCTCSGCDRRRAALAAHAGTAPAGRYKCGCPVVPSDEIEAFCPTHREPMTR